MKKSGKILVVVLILVILAGCAIGAYFLFRNKSSDGGSGGGDSGLTTSRYDGMYYYNLYGTTYKTEYIKIKGNQWSSADGDSGTYKVDGTNISFYKRIMGDDEVILSGTIDDGIIKVRQDIAGIEMYVYYCQDGKTPND